MCPLTAALPGNQMSGDCWFHVHGEKGRDRRGQPVEDDNCAGFDSSEDDPVFLQARLLMVRAVLDKAPLAGALTLLKLRRARNRADLAELLDEVETRISRPHRSLAAMHTMRRVRQMLGGRADSALQTA